MAKVVLQQASAVRKAVSARPRTANEGEASAEPAGSSSAK